MLKSISKTLYVIPLFQDSIVEKHKGLNFLQVQWGQQHFKQKKKLGVSLDQWEEIHALRDFPA